MGNKFELYCMSSSGEATRLTPLVGKIEWSDNVDELAMKLQFNVAYNDDRFFPKTPVEVGSSITFEGEKGNIGEFIVTEEDKQGRGEIPYIAMDYAWYLNKSKETYQFNGIPCKQAIEEVCKKVGVTIGKYTLPDATISKIYFDRTHSDVLKDILEYILQETGEICRMRMEGKELFFYTNEEEYIKPVFKFTPAVNKEFNSLDAIMSPSKKSSIEEMRNSIKIIVNENEGFRLVTEVKDEGNISKYGLLQEIISIDAAKGGDAEEIANNKLKELNRVFEEIGIEVPGDERIKAGKFLEVDEPITGIVDKYMVASSSHVFQSGVHKCSVTLKSKATLDAENAGLIADSILGKEVPPDMMGSGELVGGSIEEQVWFFLKAQGFSEAAIAGIMGNIYQESKFDTSMIEKGSGAGFGLCQWTGTRRTDLNNFAKAKGKSPSDLQTQLEFLMHEMTGAELWRFGGKAGLDAFKKMTDPKKAAKYFSDNYERPGNPMMNVRTSAAEKYYNSLKGKTPPAPSGGTVSAKTASFLAAAQRYNGVKYVYGAMSSSGIDCSGLITMAMKAVGINPKGGRMTSRSIHSDPAFMKISKSQLRPGDILSMDGHVAIYAGNGKTFEATPPRVGTYNMSRNNFTAFYRIKGLG